MGKSKRKEERKNRKESRRSRSRSADSRRADSNSSSDSDDGEAGLRALGCVARNKGRRLRKCLRRRPALATTQDSRGQTLLHQACLCGHLEAAQMLLKYGADARVQDCVGNTPAHVAGLHGHLVLMSTLLQGPRPPDVDTVLNAAGQSILQIANTAMAVSTAAAAGPKLASLSGTREEQHEEEEVDGDEAWAAKLCDHDSDGEDGWGADDGGGWGAGAGSGDGGPETDDAWADRLWAEMQGRRRAASQAASAAFFGGARAQARDDVAIAAAAARATGAARMLELERTKDSAWRARASAGFIGPAPPPGGGGGGGGGAGAAGGGQRQQQQQQSPAFVDHASLRGEYEAKWAALDARAALAGASTAGASASGAVRGGGVAEGDVPWPVPAGCGPSDLAEVLLWGVAGPAELKARLRQEIMRWHPDKFTARFGALLSPGCHGAVLARVKGVSQQVTALMASGGRVQ